uniref:Uncharacterized protein n=1 Tax=Meloidogyne enterolobii TaxID=390850 RepID=A0A6V7VGY0_MELEN|nr:unnamed protein product [Meloidogyne enterolobii]
MGQNKFVLKEQDATNTTLARNNVKIHVALDVQLLLQCHQKIQTGLLVVIKKDFLIFVK